MGPSSKRPPFGAPLALHAVSSADPYAQRATIVLQWRLSPLYQLRPGLARGSLLGQFEGSARDRTRQEEGEAQEGEDVWQPTIEPAASYQLFIQGLVSLRCAQSWDG